MKRTNILRCVVRTLHIIKTNMPAVIRATDRHRGASAEVFNFDDIAVRAKTYLGGIRTEAEESVERARREADTIRSRAERDGRQAAMDAVEEMIRKQLSTALPALRKVIEDIQHAKQAWLTHWEAGAVHVAAAIAERLIRRELPEHPEITMTLIREALELAAGSSQLRIRMNPDDHKALGGKVEMLVEELSGLAGAEVTADKEITPGGCLVETQFGVIDQQFEAQLKRIEEELT